MNILRLLLNAILPPRCIKCGKILSENNGLCAKCFQKISFIAEPYCQCCGKPLIEAANSGNSALMMCAQCLKNKRKIIQMQRASFIYNDVSKDLILNLKFRDKTLSAEALAKMMFRAGHDIWLEEPDLLIPVPMHRLRLIKRRFNQAALLAKHLSKQTLIPVDYSSLVRIENTVPQVNLSGAARRNNLKHAFVVKNVAAIKNKKVVIIDDVKTTGSTLLECAKALHKAGAACIYALSIAQTDNRF